MGAASSCIAVSLLARVVVGVGECPQEAPSSPHGFSGEWPQELDVAVYWYGAGGRRERAGGDSGLYYDSSRHTLIYIHGWEGGHGGTTARCHRASPTCHVGLCPEGEDLAEPWIERGWNVGYFYWDQFADEPCPRDAEHKIWRASNQTEEGMRWLGYDDNGEIQAHFFRSAGKSVAELCAETVAAAVPAPGAGTEVRIVGHSIGAQLAARCADLLHDSGEPSAPQRVALLEPYFTLHVWFPFRCDSTNMSDGFGLTVASQTAELIRHLAHTHSVVTEVWKSSMLTENRMFGVPNSALENEGVYVELTPNWCGQPAMEYLECRHGAAYSTYFRSGSGEPSSESECPVPLPSCPTYAMPHYVGTRWMQTSGRDTYATDDDIFAFDGRRSNASNESYFDIPEGESARSVAASLLGLQSEDGSGSWWLPLLGAVLLVCVSVALVCCGRALCGAALKNTKRVDRSRALQSTQLSRHSDEDQQAADHMPLLSTCSGERSSGSFYLCGGDSEEESEDEAAQHLATVIPEAQLTVPLPSSSAPKLPEQLPDQQPPTTVRPQPLVLLSPSPQRSIQSVHELQTVTSLHSQLQLLSPGQTPRLLESLSSRGDGP